MKAKIRVIIGVVLITVAVTGTAFGWMGCGRQGRDDSCRRGKMEAISKDLNLTTDQEEALKSTKEAYRTQLGDLRLALKEKRETLKGELSKPGVTRQDVQPIVAEIKGLVEKPAPERAPSTASIIGRYILQPEIFEHLGKSGRGAGGEIQLTDSMAKMIGKYPFHGLRFEGKRFDCGDKIGFFEANVAYALARGDLNKDVKAILRHYAGN